MVGRFFQKVSWPETSEICLDWAIVSCPTRLPVRTLTNEQFTNLYKDLEKINFFSYTSKKISVSPKLIDKSNGSAESSQKSNSESSFSNTKR